MPSQDDQPDFGDCNVGDHSDNDTIMASKSTSTDPYHKYMSMYEACAGNKSSDLYEEYGPMYTTCAKLAQPLGKNGEDIMGEGLRDIYSQMKHVMSMGLSGMRSRLAEQHSVADGRLSGGMESLPTLVRQACDPAQVSSCDLAQAQRKEGNPFWMKN